MSNSKISKAIKTTREASSILTNARNKMLKSSFQTAKQVAGLYKDAGMEVFKLGKKVLSQTVRLTIDNQKELLQTSGDAIREAAKTIRETEPETQQKPQNKKRGRKKKKEVTIDDLI